MVRIRLLIYPDIIHFHGCIGEGRIDRPAKVTPHGEV